MSEIDNKGKEDSKETPAAQAAGSKAEDEEDKKQEDEPEGITLDSEEVDDAIEKVKALSQDQDNIKNGGLALLEELKKLMAS